MLAHYDQPRTAHTSHRLTGHPDNRTATRAPRTRRHWRWRIFGRRDEITMSQRCLALHLHFAAPRSALEL
jgi:hypothetical protein